MNSLQSQACLDQGTKLIQGVVLPVHVWTWLLMKLAIGDNLQLVCGLEVKAVKALLHDRLDLHEVVNVRVGEHRVHLLG